MTMPQTFIGVDVSKHWIDVHHLSSSRGERVATTPAALRAFAATLGSDAFVICEASGGYERPLTDALAVAKVAYLRVNPRQARDFAAPGAGSPRPTGSTRPCSPRWGGRSGLRRSPHPTWPAVALLRWSPAATTCK